MGNIWYSRKNKNKIRNNNNNNKGTLRTGRRKNASKKKPLEVIIRPQPRKQGRKPKNKLSNHELLHRER